MDYGVKTNSLDQRLDRAMRRRRELIWKLKEQQKQITSVLPVVRNKVPHRNSDANVGKIYESRNTTNDTYHLQAYSSHPPVRVALSSFPYLESVPGTVPAITQLPWHPDDSRKQTKTEIMDLMMVQNAQVHQLAMQQMTLSFVRPQTLTQSTGSERKMTLHLDDFIRYLKKRDEGFRLDFPYNANWIQLTPVSTMLYYQPQPLRPPKAIRRHKPKPVVAQAPEKKRSIIRRPPRLLGSKYLKRFRRVALAVLFTVILDHNRRNPDRVPMLNEKFLFGIRLRESIATMQRIFLRPEKKIFRILRKVLDDKVRDLTVVLRTDVPSDEKLRAYDELGIMVESIVYEMTEIMPTKGVLGTNRKSTVYRMIQPGQMYPRGYLWQIEKELLKMGSNESLEFVSDSDASILLTGHFLGRGIVTSLVLKPREFRLLPSSAILRRRVELNLRLLASLLFYVICKSYGSWKATKSHVFCPAEYEWRLYDESQLTTVFTNLRKSLDYSEQLLTKWSKEYTTRLRAVR